MNPRYDVGYHGGRKVRVGPAVDGQDPSMRFNPRNHGRNSIAIVPLK